MRDIRVIYRKFDGSLHWHLTMRWLGEDEHGRWLGMEPGGTMRKGHGGPLVPIPHAHVGLFPHTGWWTAWFNAEPEPVEVYCDITTPVRWTSQDEVTMVDLDLDVCRMRADRSVRLLDEDEFAEHQRLYGYPQNVVREAENAAQSLLDAVTDGDEPFTDTFRSWFARLGDRPA